MNFPETKPKICFENKAIDETGAHRIEFLWALSLEEAKALRTFEGEIFPDWFATVEEINKFNVQELSEPRKTIKKPKVSIRTPLTELKILVPVDYIINEVEKLKKNDPPGLTYYIENPLGRPGLFITREYPEEEVENPFYEESLALYEERKALKVQWLQWVSELKRIYISVLNQCIREQNLVIENNEEVDPQLQLFNE